jgi:hypothetical protein
MIDHGGFDQCAADIHGQDIRVAAPGVLAKDILSVADCWH